MARLLAIVLLVIVSVVFMAVDTAPPIACAPVDSAMLSLSVLREIVSDPLPRNTAPPSTTPELIAWLPRIATRSSVTSALLIVIPPCPPVSVMPE